MSELSIDAPGPEEMVSRVWWIFLVTGTLWLLFAIIVFRFDWTTVSAISILFGIVMLAAGIAECLAAAGSHGWWRAIHIVLAIVFVGLAIVAFVHPGNTFAALAAVMSFYFVIKGTFDVVVAIATKAEHDLWWLTLVVGIVEIGIGFWAAGDFGRKTILLVVWVGVAALLRGISEIVFGFALRRAGKNA